MHRVNFRMLCIWSQVQLGQFDSAQSLIAEAHAIESDRENFWQKPLLWALEGEIHRALGDEVSRKLAIAKALAAARQGDYWYVFVYPFNFQAMCCYALETGIDPEYTRHIIRRLGWRSPSQLVLHWPWQVRIYALGEFRILRDDQPVQFGRKAPRRLLAVLKALIAFGGRDVPAERLADALWPEVEGPSASGSLTTALRRLRELLGGDFVGETDGKVSLDEGAVWLDTWAFDAASAEVSGAAHRQLALTLYKGALLSDEPDARWAVQPRARLSTRFVELIRSESARLEAEGEWHAAASLYRRGLEADDLAESFYRGLMRCQYKQGQRAEALGTYRRMQQVLSVVLGVSPSEESLSLHRTITGQ